MPSIKKLKPLPPPVAEQDIVWEELEMYFNLLDELKIKENYERDELKFKENYERNHLGDTDRSTFSIANDDDRKRYKELLDRKSFTSNSITINRYEELLDRKSFTSNSITINRFKTWSSYLDLDFDNTSLSPSEIYEKYLDLLKQSDVRPLRVKDHTYYEFIFGKKPQGFDKLEERWVYKGFEYGIERNNFYSDDEKRLLILEEFDKERKRFEKLRDKFDESSNESIIFDRFRIPEKIRVEVWRRDSGKCARCGSREKLEYDHIVPISKGGSNTARNIELLCEKCNRSKSNNVV